jgi:hypothetical protein
MKNLMVIVAVMISVMASGQVEGMDRYTGSFSSVGDMELCKYNKDKTFNLSGVDINRKNIEEVLLECLFILGSNDIDFDRPIADESTFMGDINDLDDIFGGLIIGEHIDKAWGMMTGEDEYVVFWIFMSDFTIEFGFEFREE